LKQDDGLKAGVGERFTCTTTSGRDQPVALDILDRQLSADAPSQRCVGAATEFVINESGKLNLAGWAVSAVNDRHLTLRATD
jgi:hypothetical protein